MWKKLESAQELGTNCKCGIRFRGKEMLLSPSECLMDKMTYVEDSVEIVGASGGYPDSLDEGLLSGGINLISRDCPAKRHVLMSAVI